MDQLAIEYYRSRERKERLAAKKATCAAARRVHQEMALRYASLLRRSGIDRMIFFVEK